MAIRISLRTATLKLSASFAVGSDAGHCLTRISLTVPNIFNYLHGYNVLRTFEQLALQEGAKF